MPSLLWGAVWGRGGGGRLLFTTRCHQGPHLFRRGLTAPYPSLPNPKPNSEQQKKPTLHHKVLIVGGGSAGLAVAAQLRNKVGPWGIGGLFG